MITRADLWNSAVKYHPDTFDHAVDFATCPHRRCESLRAALKGHVFKTTGGRLVCENDGCDVAVRAIDFGGVSMRCEGAR
jgi:hypothetical protein